MAVATKARQAFTTYRISTLTEWNDYFRMLSIYNRHSGFGRNTIVPLHRAGENTACAPQTPVPAPTNLLSKS
jgi:hypothetical protein